MMTNLVVFSLSGGLGEKCILLLRSGLCVVCNVWYEF